MRDGGQWGGASIPNVTSDLQRVVSSEAEKPKPPYGHRDLVGETVSGW